jgi:hypothetical protein
VEHPIRVAWCNLLFANNGGAVDDRLRPIRPPPEDEENKEYVRGLCDKAWDCGVCPILHRWVAAKTQEGWSVGWWCSDCIEAAIYPLELQHGKEGSKRYLSITGYYQSGRPDYPPDHKNFDQDRPPIHGCTRCGKESSFLQLIYFK